MPTTYPCTDNGLVQVRIATDLHELMASNGGPLDESVTRFYVACVALGLEHLHSESICYRNLSPEMLLIDSHGYIQLMDMRFAVKIDGTEPRDKPYTGDTSWFKDFEVHTLLRG